MTRIGSVFAVLLCIPLNAGDASQSGVEQAARWFLWIGTLASPVLFVVAAGLLLYALLLGLPLEKGGEKACALAGTSLLAAFPAVIMGVRAWLGNFTLVW